MTPPPDLPLLSSSEKDALILALIARLNTQEAGNASLRERPNLPAKTPDNSSKPPSQGQKPNVDSEETYGYATRACSPDCLDPKAL